MAIDGYVRNTHTTDTIRIAWVPSTRSCCPNQGTFETSETTIAIWDDTGTGTWRLQPIGQCGGCDTTIYPTAAILSDEVTWMMDLDANTCTQCEILHDEDALIDIGDNERMCQPCADDSCNWGEHHGSWCDHREKRR